MQHGQSEMTEDKSFWEHKGYGLGNKGTAAKKVWKSLMQKHVMVHFLSHSEQEIECYINKQPNYNLNKKKKTVALTHLLNLGFLL